VIFVNWGEILYLQVTTWFYCVLNLHESWLIDLVKIRNIC